MQVSDSEIGNLGQAQRNSRDCAETYALYAAQEIPQIDAEIAQKGHFLIETI